MLSFLLASSNLPFTIALVLLLMIAALEGVGLLLGFGLATLWHHFEPDISIDLDSPDGIEGDSSLTKLLGWLHLGKVPVMVLLILFLAVFGLGGLLVQAFAHAISGQHLNIIVAVNSEIKWLIKITTLTIWISSLFSPFCYKFSFWCEFLYTIIS